MRNPVTFADLRQFLLRLGFVETRVPKSHLVYQHASSGTVLTVRPYRPRDHVDATTLIVVRRHLVERGLIEAAAFERLLEGTAA